MGDNYCTWGGSGWNLAGTKETPVVSGLSWTANGGDMSLVLTDAEGNPIDMSGLREIAKNHVNAFTVTMRAALTMTEPACQAGIVASQNSGTDRYTKPNYRAYLSTHADTLSTSSNSAYNDGGAGYYRMDVAHRPSRSRRLRNPSWASTSMTSSPLTARSLWWVPTT